MFYRTLNAYRKDQSDSRRLDMIKARYEYKSTVRTCKYRKDKENTIKLENARFKNAKLYWKMLKDTAGCRSPNISLDQFSLLF